MRAVRVTVLAGAAASALGCPAVAAPETAFSVVLSSEVGYSRNPFLSTGDTSTGAVEFGAAPELRISDARGQTTIGGRYYRTEWFRRYDASESYGGGLTSTRTLSESLSGNVKLDYDSSVLALVDPIDLPVTAGRNQRERYLASAGLKYRPTARDTWTLDGDASRSKYSSRRLDSNWTYSVKAGYDRTLSETSTLGGRVSYTRADYEGPFDTDIVTPQLVYTTKLDAFWSLEAGLGLLYISRPSGDQTSVSGDLSLCRKDDRLDLCFDAARDAGSTGFGGVRIATSAGVDLGYRLTERSRITAAARYSRSTSRDDFFQRGSVDYVNADVGYEHRLTQAITVGARGAYRDLSDDLTSRRGDLSGRLFVRASVGDLAGESSGAGGAP